MKKTIKVYSYPKCPYCGHLKELLNNDKIDYIDVNIELKENEEEFKQISETSKCDQVPIVVVGTQILIPEVSFRSIEEAASLTKKLSLE